MMLNCPRKVRPSRLNPQHPEEGNIMAKKKSTPSLSTSNGAAGALSPEGSSQAVMEVVARFAADLEKQNSTLDAATSETTELARSLQATAQQAASVSRSTEETGSSINQIAASAEQATASIAQVATSCCAEFVRLH
jgi:peptidoglycan hydrolase CwlO-like protein